MSEIIKQMVIGVIDNNPEPKVLKWDDKELRLVERSVVLMWLAQYDKGHVFMVTVHDDHLSPTIKRIVKMDSWRFA